MSKIEGDRNGFRSRSRSPRHRSRSPRRTKRRESRWSNPTDDCSKRVIVSNIPYDQVWQDLKDLFRKEVGEVTFVEVPKDSAGNSKGVALVEFKDEDSARKALDDMHRFQIKDRKLVVRKEKPRDALLFERLNPEQNDPYSRMGGGGGMGGGMGIAGIGPMGMMGSGLGAMGGGYGSMGGGMSGGMGSMGGGMMSGMSGGMSNMGGGGMGGGMGSGMGSSMGMGGSGMSSNMGGGMSSMGGGVSTMTAMAQQLCHKLGIDGPISNTVFVANLDYSVTTRKLREVFRMAGKVINVDLKEDKEGKSRGMAIVTFENPLAAVQSVSLFNGQMLFDRAMAVRLDKEADQDMPTRLPGGLQSIGMGLGAGGAPLQQFDQINSMMGSSSGGMSSMDTGMSLGGGMGSGGGMSMGGGMSSGFGSMGLGIGDSIGSGMGSMGMNYGSSVGLGDSFNRRGGRGMDSMTPSYGGGGDRRGGQQSGGRSSGGFGQLGVVIVKNLPYSVTWQSLKERFRDVGDVKFAEINMEEGKSTGVGKVRFSTHEDAIRAVNTMHRNRIDGREIVVKMAEQR